MELKLEFTREEAEKVAVFVRVDNKIHFERDSVAFKLDLPADKAKDIAERLDAAVKVSGCDFVMIDVFDDYRPVKWKMDVGSWIPATTKRDELQNRRAKRNANRLEIIE